MTRIPLKIKQLGEQDYASCYQNMQTKILDNIALKKNGVAVVNELWLVEHPSVYTLGQAGDEAHVLNAHDIPVVKTDRGGQVTWHGKGQLVAYFLFDLSTLDWHVRQLVNIAEKSICELIKPYLADGFIIKVRKDAPGVYIYRQTTDTEILHGKIASLGFKIKRGFSYHGIAININADLIDFTRINPCGYKGMTMLNLTDVCTEKSLIDFSKLQQQYAELLLDYHNQKV